LVDDWHFRNPELRSGLHSFAPYGG
jgi:hypothetical protein